MCDCFKSKTNKESQPEEEEDAVFDPKLIHFDQFGNLIYDQDADIPDREAELRKILEINPGDLSVDGLTWYLMDAPWVDAWLYYTVKDKEGVAPRPGPCYNNRLIEWFDPSEKKIVVFEDGETKDNQDTGEAKADDAISIKLVEPQWVCKKVLSCATESRTGDYRRVNEETWTAFKSLYPGSGPTITTVFVFDKKYNDNGYYPTHNFKIVDPPPNPRKLIKSTSFFGFGRSSTAAVPLETSSKNIHTNDMNAKSNNSNKDTNLITSAAATSFVTVGGISTNKNDKNSINDSSNSYPQIPLQNRNARVLSDPVINPMMFYSNRNPPREDLETIDLAEHAVSMSSPVEEEEIEAMKVGILGRAGHDSDDDKDSDDDTYM